MGAGAGRGDPGGVLGGKKSLWEALKEVCSVRGYPVQAKHEPRRQG